MNKIHALNEEFFYKQGISLGDRLDVFPEVCGKRTTLLNRKNFSIQKSDGFEKNQQNGNIFLPSLRGVNFDLNLSLCAIGEQSFYRVKSNTLSPFRVNGVYSFDTVLKNNDELTVGYNKLKFTKYRKEMTKKIKLNYDIGEVSKKEINVLLQGDTGTGKSYLARRIHEESGCAGRFIHINLSSFSPSLIESEIFGHVKGAFTGAVSDKKGAVLEANNGTLFIDEIDSLPIEMQSKLLLFFDNLKVRPVGGYIEKSIKAKIIVASGRDLFTLVEGGLFREDLYYRLLSGYLINLPSLREKRSIIVSMINDYESEHNIVLSKSLRSFYENYDWPGNLRQLLAHLNLKRNFSKDDYWVFDNFDERLTSRVKPYELKENIISLNNLKKQYVRSIYLRTNFSARRTAQLLKITPNTVRSLVRY